MITLETLKTSPPTGIVDPSCSQDLASVAEDDVVDVFKRDSSRLSLRIPKGDKIERKPRY